MTTTLDLPRDRVHPNPDQPRKHFNADDLAELAASIGKVGIVQPLTVITIPGDLIDPDPTWMIVAGERRWRAAGIAELATVPCVIRDDLDATAVHVIATTENLIRADMLPSEEAKAVKRMLDDGMADDAADAADQLGKSTGWVEQRLRLLDLRDDLALAVDRGEISAANGAYISFLDAAGQQAVVWKLNDGQLTTQSAVRAFARALWHAQQQPDLFGESDADTDGTVKAERDKTVRTVQAKVDGLDRKLTAVATALGQLVESSPAELAVGLGADAATLHATIAGIARQATNLTDRIAAAIQMQGLTE